MASGIFGSALTLWINKKFDYNAKKYDLLVDYFFTVYKFTNLMANVLPIGLHENKRVKDSYEKFYNSRGLWNEIQHITTKLKFTKKDEKIEHL